MPELTLYRGNRNYSSWSFRGWLALRLSGLPFREEAFDLGSPGTREAVGRHSPTSKVPALRDGDLVIWDSLAIFEYLAELVPGAGLWPGDTAARAVARAVSAEMHSGHENLRRGMPMNVRASCPGKGRGEGVQPEIERVIEIWRDCRARFGQRGPFLFGEWSLADCSYAPVVSRFLTYHVEVDGDSKAYMDAVWSRPEVGEWRAAAEAEPMIIPLYEL